MQSQRAVVQLPTDPKVTENFLLNQPEVLDASVWFTEGSLMAHVTIEDDNAVSVSALQKACLDSLGLHQTPRQIFKICARQNVA